MCGIFGAVERFPETGDIGRIIYRGLLPVQHRGQDSTGISVSQADTVRTRGGMGTMDIVFQPEVSDEDTVDFVRDRSTLPRSEAATALGSWRREEQDRSRSGEPSIAVNPLDEIVGTAAIGHVRYSTQGKSGSSRNIHPIPFLFDGKHGTIAHNGNVLNCDELRAIVRERDPSFCFIGDTDTEVIAALFETSQRLRFEDALTETLPLLRGAFSLAILYNESVYAVRDKRGIRPLVVGKSNSHFFVASETCSFASFNVTEFSDVKPGEIWVFNQRTGGTNSFWTEERSSHPCSLEVVYFSAPDSLLMGQENSEARKSMGRILAQEHPVTDADIVVPILDSGLWAAIGFSEELGVPRHEALVRGRVYRTFIEPIKEEREIRALLKFRPIKGEIRGRHIVLVDDSIVRGTTLRVVVRMLRAMNPRKISVRIASPPVIGPCFLGVATPDYQDLIANGRTNEEVCEYLGADSLEYLSLKGLDEAMQLQPGDDPCKGCFTAQYPVPKE